MILKALRLRPGDRIGIIAPAGPVDASEMAPGIALLESQGYEVVPSDHLYDRQGYLAGEDAARLHDLHAMFRDGAVRAILCARGGYGSMRLLEKIDFDLIGRNPRIFVGYSDITALLWAMHARTRLVTVHGPMVRELLRDEGRNLEYLLDLLSSERPPRLDLSGATVLRRGHAVGPLFGGNLSLICHLLGTPFLPSLQGALLFIEDRGEPPYRVDRMLTHLRLGGVLEGLAGVVAGSFDDCGEPSELDGVLAEVLSGLDIPVVSGLPVGHAARNVPLPIGIPAELDTEAMRLSVLEPCVAF
ncbi:MAG: LD-carboxypeptidase [Deltaproteobacteria bacterium]|nr:LD-carboxypeptidase [Deltaproteobacteria bacterium]